MSKKLDVIKRGIESIWNIQNDRVMMALDLTMTDKSMAVNMSFQREYAERYDWMKQQFIDWAFTYINSFLYYEDYDTLNEETRQMMFSFMLTDSENPIKLCRHYTKALVASRSSAVFCSLQCKNKHNVYKSRAKKNRSDREEQDNDCYIRIGNESVIAPDYVLNQLVLKGMNRTYDSLISEYDFKDYVFSKIILLNEGVGFVKRNMKTRWKKTTDSRIEMPEYCERSVFEALVNALIHRDYLVLGSGFKKITETYHAAHNYREELEPKFYSDFSSFCVTLYNLNYNIPLETADNGDNKVVIDRDNLTIEESKVAIDRLNAKQPIKNKALSVFNRMGFTEVFGRTEVSQVTGDSVTSAGNLIKRLYESGLITPVTGQGKGKYKFTEPQT